MQDTKQPNYLKTIGLIIAIATLWRFILSFAALSADEAHYALYAIYLDWSYLDHPPLVGWLQAFILLFTDTEWALRLWSTLLHLLTVLGLIKLCKTLYPNTPQTIWYSVILYESLLLMQLLGIALIPETPMLALAPWCVILSIRITANPHDTAAWLMLGLLFGIAGLSKYTAIFLPIGAAIYFSLSGVYWWKNPRFYAALSISILCIMPVVYWNMQYDFISFSYQLQHGAIEQSQFNILAFFRNQLIQIFIYSPLLFIAGWWFALTGLWQNRTDVKIYSAFSLPLLLLFAYSSSKGGHYLPHWTALPMLLAIPILAYASVQSVGRLKAFMHWNIGYNVLILVIFSTLATMLLPTNISQNIFRDINGWDKAAQQAQQYALTLPKNQQQIIVSNRWHASRIAWYARPMPVKILDKRRSQYQLWEQHNPITNNHGILVLPQAIRPKIHKQFRRCNQLPSYHVGSHFGKQTFHFYHCY